MCEAGHRPQDRSRRSRGGRRGARRRSLDPAEVRTAGLLPAAASQPSEPDLGQADQAGVEIGSLTGCSLWRPDEGDRLPRTAAGRRDLPADRQVDKTLRHCGLWNPESPRAPPPEHGCVHDPDRDSAGSDEPRELTFVDETTFWATFQFSPTPFGPRTVRARRGIHPAFATRSAGKSPSAAFHQRPRAERQDHYRKAVQDERGEGAE